MKFTKESILIDNQKAFTFFIHYDWRYGLIWLSKHTSKGEKIRITTKDIPISTNEKDKFYRSRSGWGAFPEAGLMKECSYVLEGNNPHIFKYWKDFMYDRYMKLKKRQAAKDAVENDTEQET